MNIKIQDAEEYIPYGEDWEKEMMKLPKKFLIEQLKNQWQQSQQPKEADGWISVEDKTKLPNKFKKVLVITSYENIAITCIDSSGKFDTYPIVEENAKITHWQPLPSPPKNNT